MILSSPASAGGISGNGGGLWACLSSQDEIEQAVLVDFHEARDQFKRKLITTSRTDPFEAAKDLEGSIRARFPRELAETWIRLYADVKSRIRPVESEIVVVYDVNNLLKPKPALCASGWKYLQFANYTDYNEVLIRQDYWEHPRISVLDKAGLLWHEVIYRWMRETYGDKNSVRARRIVGVLFSTRGDPESQSALSEILAQSSGEPADLPKPILVKPAFKPIVICVMTNSINSTYFYAYGANKLIAKNNALAACQAGGSGFHCEPTAAEFGTIKQPEEKIACAVKNGISGTVFTEMGRSKLEAAAKARVACVNGGDAFHCRSEVECE